MMLKSDKRSGMSSSFDDLKKLYFVFPRFTESLLTLNHLVMFLSSLFLVRKIYWIILFEWKRLVSSANIIEPKTSDAFARSLI